MTTQTRARNGSSTIPVETQKTDTNNFDLPSLEIINLDVRLLGASPLIVHRWSEKAKREMLDKQMKKSSAGKAAKDPVAEYEASLYRMSDGSHGFPSVAFKAAAVRAGTYADQKMTFLRGAFHVTGEYVQIEGEPAPREDMVRVGMGTADIRYRGMFPVWAATIPVELNRRALSVEQLLNLFRIAGFSVGVGEWRPERDGQFGRFTVAQAIEKPVDPDRVW